MWALFAKAARGGHPDAQEIYASALQRGKIDGKEIRVNRKKGLPWEDPGS